MEKTRTTEQFIKNAKKIHGDKYDYSLVEFESSQKKVKIIYDNITYEQTPNKHLTGRCPEKNNKLLSMNETLNDKFIREAKLLYSNRYDYSKVEYINNNTKVVIIFNGFTYTQTPNSHLSGRQPENYNKRKTTEEFIKESIGIHGDKYDYSLVDYKNCDTPVKIILDGVIYEQRPDKHLTGRCPEKIFKKLFTKEEFITKSQEVHGDRYDYSLVDYKGWSVEVLIKLNGIIYNQLPGTHIQGMKPEDRNHRKTSETFIEESILVHGDKYDYSLVDYKNNKTKVKIVCSKHGIFEQVPSSHLIDKGCRYCYESKGNKRIESYLKLNNIIYIREKTFDDCIGFRKLPFDFYIPDINTLIEYDGKQHYESIEFFGGDKMFELRQKNDSIKNRYCENNNIRLIRIPYTENKNIEKLLDVYLKDMS